MKYRAKWLMAAMAMTAVAGGVCAQTSSNSAAAPTVTPAYGHWHQHGDRMLGGGLMLHTLHELNLTDAQKQSVKQILIDARTQFRAQHQAAGVPNLAALSNPGDPNHAAALQDMQTRMAARIQARDQVQQQIYGVLTSDQKTQLASILAARQAKMMSQHSAS